MRVLLKLILSLFLVAFGSVGGFLAATKYRSQLDAMASQIMLADNIVTSERKIIYYRNPMGEPDISAVPKKDSMDMDYIPVYEDEIPGQSGLMAPKPKPAANEKKILYYRNPMGLPDTSPEPKKDSMGMDYIAVYDDENSEPVDPSVVKINVEKVQRAGVRTEAVEKHVLSEPLRVPGTVALDERLERSITIRTEGFIEKVYAGATGQHVKAGEPLFRIYSPQIVQAAVEYRIAAAGGQKAIGAKKLRNYGVPETYIKSIPLSGEVPLSLDWPSPVDGVLMSKSIVVGARVMPGDELYRLADVSNVWIIADVPEQDVGRVAIGNPVSISVRAFPGEAFLGKVAFVLPELKKETRTAQVRIELPNPNHRLLHGMYADVNIDTGSTTAVVAVPESAVIDSGNKQVAIIEVGEGRFKPQEVKLGHRGGGQVEILEGLAVGDKIVTRANFLIDAESNLQAAFTALVANDGAAK
jgi:membrane fusion protein, copper/silver efflux system